MPTARVLIIDDDPDFRASARSLLEAHDYTVVEAASGTEGLQKLAEQRPDVILLDVMMECCTEGYGVNQAIKWKPEFDAFHDIPIVMVSSIQETPDELYPMAGEVEMIRPDWYVTKPIDIQKFLDVVHRASAALVR